MPTKEEHISRHIMLHKKLDELVADYLAETGLTASGSSILDLLKWSDNQTIEPSDKHNKFR